MGPFAHKAVMEGVVNLINRNIALPVKLQVGAMTQLLEPDISGPHDNWGQLTYDYFEEMKRRIKIGYDIDQPVRNICHFILDYHAFTQSFGTSRSDDGMIDAFAETVTDKNQYPVSLLYFNSKEEVMNAVNASINEMNNRFSRSFRKSKLRFLISSEFRNFIRLSVQRSTEYGAAYIRLAAL